MGSAFTGILLGLQWAKLWKLAQMCLAFANCWNVIKLLEGCFKKHSHFHDC